MTLRRFLTYLGFALCLLLVAYLLSRRNLPRLEKEDVSFTLQLKEIALVETKPNFTIQLLNVIDHRDTGGEVSAFFALEEKAGPDGEHWIFLVIDDKGDEQRKILWKNRWIELMEVDSSAMSATVLISRQS